jgi:ubiquinone/menaquinone biosynthesis C-methylase UbiE
MHNLSYITADLAAKRVTVRTDIVELPFKTDCFDAIICNHVLEHVVDDRTAMKELYRILKPGGWAVVQSPLDVNRNETFEDFNVVLPQDRERLFGQFDHVRIYGLDYRGRLEEAGIPSTCR